MYHFLNNQFQVLNISSDMPSALCTLTILCHIFRLDGETMKHGERALLLHVS